MAAVKPKTVEELTKELEVANNATATAVKAAEDLKKASEQEKLDLKKASEQKEKSEESQETMIVHRKATWATVIGDHKFMPGYIKIKGAEEIAKIKKTSAWKSETKPNPLHHGRPNMVEVIVKEEAKATFAETIAAMGTKTDTFAAVELISHHGDIEDVRAVLTTDKRKDVKDAAKNQIVEIESRDK